MGYHPYLALGHSAGMAECRYIRIHFSGLRQASAHPWRYFTTIRRAARSSAGSTAQMLMGYTPAVEARGFVVVNTVEEAQYGSESIYVCAAPPLERPYRRLGPDLAAPHAAAVAGAGGENTCLTSGPLSIRRAICAPGTRAREVCSIRPTQVPSSSTTTTLRCCRTLPRIREKQPNSSWRGPSAAFAASCASRRATISTLAQMDLPDIRRVVDVWSDQYEELGAPVMGKPRAGVRKSRRNDGSQQSASARPDLGQ